MIDKSKVVHIASGNEITPEAISRWSDSGIKVVIIDSAPVPNTFQVEEMVMKLYDDKEKMLDISFIDSKEIIKERKQHYKGIQQRHNYKPYKRK